MEETFRLRGSQGETSVTARHRFTTAGTGEVLTYTAERSTRTSGPPTVYQLKKVGWKQAYVLTLEDNWEIGGKLPVNAMLISLQGVVNKNGPLMYIMYPEDWPFTYVTSVFGFYRDTRNYSFQELRTAANALATLKQYVKGYIVWDTKVRNSLTVAFTIAGLECGGGERRVDPDGGTGGIEKGGGPSRNVRGHERHADLHLGL